MGTGGHGRSPSQKEPKTPPLQTEGSGKDTLRPSQCRMISAKDVGEGLPTGTPASGHQDWAALGTRPLSGRREAPGRLSRRRGGPGPSFPAVLFALPPPPPPGQPAPTTVLASSCLALSSWSRWVEARQTDRDLSGSGCADPWASWTPGPNPALGGPQWQESPKTPRDPPEPHLGAAGRGPWGLRAVCPLGPETAPSPVSDAAMMPGPHWVAGGRCPRPLRALDPSPTCVSLPSHLVCGWRAGPPREWLPERLASGRGPTIHNWVISS